MEMMRVLAFMTILFLAACDEPAPEVPPEDILQLDKFTGVMIDVQLIEGMKIHKLGPMRAKAPNMEAMYAEIFEKHSISQEDFLRTYDYYKARPEKMEGIYEQVLDSLSKLDVQVKKVYNTPKFRTDTLHLDSATKASAKRRFKAQNSKK
jgi:hypothetical protein